MAQSGRGKVQYMGNYSSVSEKVFIRLLEGIIPDRASDIAPEEYADMLTEAIQIHEKRMHEADEEIAYCQKSLNEYESLTDEALSEGEEPWADFVMYKDQMPGEIAFHKEQFLAARAMKESCEWELVRLLEAHPGLNEKE